jgi:two-component system response regulator RegX3
MRGAHVVVIEDEPAIALPLTDRLRREGLRVTHAADGIGGLRAAREDGVDLVILDLMLPGLDGAGVLLSLRESHNDVPVICLTARTAEQDRVGQLQAGADDYVTKPFSTDELVARIDAVLRRVGRRSSTADLPPVVEADGAQIDLEGHTVLRDGTREKLSALECAILRCLVERRGRATSRGQLLRAVWGPYAAVTDRTVDFHVKNLRRKIERDPAHPRILLTDHGVGYRFA